RRVVVSSWLDSHCFAACCGLIDSANHFDRPPAFAAVHQRGAVVSDCVDEVGELPGVTYVRDCRWVTRPAAGPDLRREALTYRHVLGPRFLEVPLEYVVLLDDDGAGVAMHRDRLRQTRVHTGGCLNHAEGAALELQACHSGVLNLDALVGEHGGE